MSRVLGIVTLLVFVVTTAVNAQVRRGKSSFTEGLYVGAKAGPNWGLASFTEKNKKVGGDFWASKEFTPWIDARLTLGGGLVGGQQSAAQLKSSTFFGAASVGADLLILDFICHCQHSYSRSRFKPYLGLGGGGMYYMAKQSSYGDIEYNYEDGWPNVKMNGLTAFAYGMLGLRYEFTYRWGAVFEAQGNVPFSSKFDAHDGYYAGDNWYEATGKDCFGTLMFGATYKIGGNSTWRTSSRYNRAIYLHNKKVYKRNAQRTRRR